MLDAIVLEPPRKAKACVIWMHGLGASGDDFVPAVPECHLPEEHDIRFIFPHAPQIPVTLNGGLVMPAWYDIKSLTFEEEDRQGLEQSKQAIEKLINTQIESGIFPEKILLIGFSQGGALALYTALLTHLSLAGVACLSGYLPCHQAILKEIDKQNLPIFCAHGQFDMVVPFKLGTLTQAHLLKAGIECQFHEYPIDHTVSAQELRDLGDFIRDTLIP